MNSFVRASCCTGVVVVCVGMRLTAENPVYRVHAKPLSATVRILAQSSAVKQADAGNQDTYIAELWVGKAQPRMARLIDTYQNYDDPIRHSLLASHRLIQMHLLRDENCDAVTRDVIVPPPGYDLFDKDLRSELDAEGAKELDCFIVDHHATRLMKADSADQR